MVTNYPRAALHCTALYCTSGTIGFQNKMVRISGTIGFQNKMVRISGTIGFQNEMVCDSFSVTSMGHHDQ